MTGEKYMDVVISVFGTYGDIIPSLAVAKQLRSLDKKVLFLSNSYYKQLIESQGIDFESVGTLEEYHTGMGSGGFGHHKKGNKRLLISTVGPSIKRQFDIVSSLQSSFPNMQVLVPGATNGAFMAAEKYELSVIRLLFSPLYVSQYLERVGWLNIYRRYGFEMRFLNAARAKVGLPVVQRFSELLAREKTAIGLYPDWFVGSSGMRHPAVVPVGFSLFQVPAFKGVARFEKFAGQYGPPIIFTPGTVIANPKKFFEEALKICEKLGLPGVFLGQHTGEFIGKVPDWICCLENMDMCSALRRSRMIVHHGGIGTMAQAMHAGVPQLIVPRVNDQYYNASRALALGSAGVISALHFEAGRAVAVIRNLMNNDKAIGMRQDLSSEMQRQQGCLEAARLI